MEVSTSLFTRLISRQLALHRSGQLATFLFTSSLGEVLLSNRKMAAITENMFFALMAVMLSRLAVVASYYGGDGGWGDAHATYYGGGDASGTNDGACGYGNQISAGYGYITTALSTPLFSGGDTCGACFQVRCWGDGGCLNGNPSILVTATNLCPPGSNGGWCDPPRQHFDLSQPAFSQIAQIPVGHVSIQFRRVSCLRSGDIQYTINGHTFFNLVLISNVGGAGDVASVAIKGSNTGWRTMQRNWGQNWQDESYLNGQSLSFRVTTSDGRTVTTYDVAPANWQFGQRFSGGQF